MPRPSLALPPKPARPANGKNQPSSTVFPRFNLHESRSCLNIVTSAYSLQAHQTQMLLYDQQHLAHQYRTPFHTQELNCPIVYMGPGLNNGTGVLYGAVWPTYLPYLTPQYSGMGQPVVRHIIGQAPAYGGVYYQKPYAASYEKEVLPSTAHLRPLRSQFLGVSQMPPTTAALTSGLPASPKSCSYQRTAEAEYDVSKTIVDGSNLKRSDPYAINILESSPLATSIPASANMTRGPPRKPIQPAHALWIGNLPKRVDLVDLKNYLCQDATDDIASVFLISRSNCAFVKYRCAAASAAALTRLHDSVFQSVRLVCRLRRDTTETDSRTGAVVSPLQNRGETPDARLKNKSTAPHDETSQSLDRYFALKSLTVEDLELSKQSGIWATQAHNEAKLNRAFETFNNVYLVFSANKSGEFFGYARMLSPINDDEELVPRMSLQHEPLARGSVELTVTTTVATSTSPKGRIIHDVARGTMFWEVASSVKDKDMRSERTLEHEVYKEAQFFGQPFRIQWLSSKRVLFTTPVAYAIHGMVTAR
ncbi:Nucleotide-binding alpha-beta plait [Penicillium atrosanguineum]|nr:Nucleotide-binding alpha-beta plait [Penicillium atrosanguineum]